MTSNNVLLSTVTRQRGDARLQIIGRDLGIGGRRLVLSIQLPHEVEDEIEGEDNWAEKGRYALRLSELDRLIAELQAARTYLAKPEGS